MRLVFALAAAIALACAGQALASKATEAEAAFAADRDVDAVRLYGEAIAETAADPVAQAIAYFGRGEVHAVNNRADQAIADFTAALALKQDTPSRANTLFSRGEAFSRKRQFEPALADYAEALTLAPGMIGANFARGRALRALNRPDEALKAYDAELKINPDSFRALSARADLLGLPPPKNDFEERERGDAGPR